VGKLGFGPNTTYTFGDVAMFDAVNYITEMTRASVLRPYPNLKEWHDACFARESVHGYLKSRPKVDQAAGW
jgi:glutathione S-transferase